MKKIKNILLASLMVLSSVLGNLTLVNAKTSSFLVREYETGYKTDKGTDLLKLRIKGSGISDYESHWGQVAFCIEHGAELPKGEHDYDSTILENSSTFAKAARIAYLSTYRYNNGESGGMKRYAYTQNLIWQVLGQTPNTYNIDGDYPAWKKSVMDEYNKWDVMPSFNASTQTLNVGETKTLTDSQGVIKYYETFDYTEDGIHFKHTKGQNTMTIKVEESCDKQNVQLTYQDAEKNGIGKYIKTTGSANFILKNNDKQDMICTPGYTDPKFLRINVNVNLYGNLEIAKKDNKGQFVPHTQFKVSYNSDMSDPIGTYTTGNNGKVIIENLKPSTVYIQEVSVPDHLILDNTIHSVEVKTNQIITYTATNQWKQGYIQVVKKDKKTNQIVKKAGTEFEILFNDQIVETIITNENGYAKSRLLDYGTYTIREKKAPENYVLATISKDQGVTENGKTYEISVYNEPVLGGIHLQKEDKETGRNPQGDAKLKNAEYVLKANEDILNPADNSVLFQKNEVISKKTVGNGIWGDQGTKKTDDKYQIKWSNLPMGTYRIEETKAGHGYLLDQPQIIELKSNNATQEVITKDVTSKEQVIKGQLEVAKMGSDGTSGVEQGLENVEFTMKLYSKVKEMGWDKAPIADVLKTDKTGRDTSIRLPYGVYQVKETKTPDNYYPSGDFFVTIDEDKEIEYRMVNNAPFKAWLKIIKIDELGNEVVLSDATFKLKDSQGNYVKQKVGLFYKDEWKTDETGYVVLDQMIESGVYTIEELTSPDGFLLGDDIKVNISSDNDDIVFDKDNEPVITVQFIDKKPTGKIILSKTFENDKDVEGAIFKLTAGNDIINATNGEVIYAKGDVISLKNHEDGLYEIKDGRIDILHLPLNPKGKTLYQLEEIKTLDGYVLLDQPVVFELEIKDSTTQEYVVEKEAYNQLTETYFSKQDLHGQEILGGEYSVLDKDTREVIDRWTSNGRNHLVKGLIMDKEYIFRENLAPLGYTHAQDIVFTMSENKQTIIMKDTIVDVDKLDVENQSVEGATLQIVSLKTKNIIDEWETDGQVHRVNGLMVGETYILKEVKTPKGYAKANDIEFTVLKDEDMHLQMIDKKVIFSKEDVGGQEVEGASMVVRDKDTGETVDKWISQKEPHAIDRLIVGKTYILHEDLAPIGMALAQDIEFTVSNENKDQYIKMIDTVVSVEKKDEKGQPVLGATLQVINHRTKNIVDEWITDGTAHRVENLLINETYTIKETKTPNGYHTAQPITFTVDGTNDMHLIMTDENILTDIHVHKIDSETKQPIKNKDFEFALYHDERCTDEFMRASANQEDGTATFENLSYGQVVYLKEVKAPEGYELSDKILKIVIDDQLENIGEIYDIDFENTKTPSIIVKTDDNKTPLLFILAGGLSIVGYMLLKKRGKTDEQ